MAIEDFRRPGPITLEIEGEHFRIELPTRWHRAYSRAWQIAVAEEVGEDGKMNQATGLRALDAQREAFARHCVIESPIPADQLLDQYLPLLEVLQDTATRLANAEEGRADALTKKLSAGSNGAANGAAKPISTRRSSNAGASPSAT